MREDVAGRIGCLVMLLPLFPLAGAILNGLLGRRFPKGLVTAIGCGMPLLAFVCAAWAFRFLLRGGDVSGGGMTRIVEVPLYTWLRADGGAGAAAPLDVAFGFLFDPLSALLSLVVTGVGFLIHVYSIGYMGRDPGYRRYFAYLNLFLFAMLVLVLADNLPLMFVGWEGVGLCSYLLIGFWHQDPVKADAGKKAFIVNRIGDVGFLLGMLLFFRLFGTLGFRPGERDGVVAALLNHVSSGAAATVALLLFIGAIGKSAQIPLFVWLPDAMAGPTPVSALIHAATMVTAGVYMVARMNFLYAFAPGVLQGIAVVGTATALAAGISAMAQRDIKKVLAYSTISQLGFMFLALGLGAYAAAVFHLMTHAFFKALLFLGAGAVIHALHGEQDLFKMGGLAKPLRWVFWAMLPGALALVGILPFAGFWSKDEILLAALEQRRYGLWIVGLVAALCTAFYAGRLVCLAFLGPAGERGAGGHAHGADAARGSEGGSARETGLHAPGFAMTSVLVVLAVLSFVGGWVPGYGQFKAFLLPVWYAGPSATAAGEEHGILSFGLLNAGITQLLAIAGVAGAAFACTVGRDALRRWVEDHPVGRRIRAAALEAFYVDRAYELLIVRPLKIAAFLLWLAVDVVLIDLVCVHGLAAVVLRIGKALRGLQTGIVNHYAAALAVGALLVVGLMLVEALLRSGGLSASLGMR